MKLDRIGNCVLYVVCLIFLQTTTAEPSLRTSEDDVREKRSISWYNQFPYYEDILYDLPTEDTQQVPDRLKSYNLDPTKYYFNGVPMTEDEAIEFFRDLKEKTDKIDQQNEKARDNPNTYQRLEPVAQPEEESFENLFASELKNRNFYSSEFYYPVEYQNFLRYYAEMDRLDREQREEQVNANSIRDDPNSRLASMLPPAMDEQRTKRDIMAQKVEIVKAHFLNKVGSQKRVELSHRDHADCNGGPPYGRGPPGPPGSPPQPRGGNGDADNSNDADGDAAGDAPEPAAEQLRQSQRLTNKKKNKKADKRNYVN